MKIDEKFIDGKLLQATENEKGNRNGSSDYPASVGSKKGDPSKARRDLREASGRALDHIWTTSWLKEGISPDSASRVEKVSEIVSGLCNVADKVIIVAPLSAAHAIGAVVRAVGAEPASETVAARADNFLMAGNSLSAFEYKKILNDVRGKRLAMIAISCGHEELGEIAACSIVEKLIADRHGPEELEERITAITGRRGEYLRAMAARGSARMYVLSEDIDEGSFAGCGGFLIPLAAAGIDATEFLSGFKSMLSSTIWDMDGDRYGVLMAGLAKEKAREDILFWQEELSEMAEWICALHRRAGVDSRVIHAPGENSYLAENAFRTHLFCAKEGSDVMTPIFPGASSEGTLNMLTAEKQEKAFVETGNRNPRMRFTIEDCKPHSIGEAMAFFQLSNEIAMHIVSEQ